MRTAEPGYPRVEIALSRPKLLRHLAYNGVFVFAGVLLVAVAGRFPAVLEWAMLITGGLALILFGTGLGLTIGLFFQSKAGFIVDNDGFIDHSGFGSTGRVYWSEIQSLKQWIGNGQEWILAEPSPNGRFQEEANLWTQIKQWLDYRRFGTPLVLATGTLEIDTGKLFELIQKQRSEAPQEDGHERD
jgi:hypothetical protein